MTKRERVVAALRREPVDYLPCSPFMNPQDWVQRLGHGFYESCDFYSPQFLWATLGDSLRAQSRLVHEAGSLIGYTMLTGYTPLTEHLAGIGMDCLIIPDPFFRREDPRKLSEALGPTMSFWTGPSDTVHTPFDDPEAVRQAVRETVGIFGTTGVLLTACSSFKASHPWSNFTAFVDEWRKIR